MNAAEKAEWICRQARGVGFDLCGIAPAVTATTQASGETALDGTFEELVHLPEWLARGYAGEMNYLSDPRRGDPRLVLDGARSLIVVALNYNAGLPYSMEVPVTGGDDAPRGVDELGSARGVIDDLRHGAHSTFCVTSVVQSLTISGHDA